MNLEDILAVYPYEPTAGHIAAGYYIFGDYYYEALQCNLLQTEFLIVNFTNEIVKMYPERKDMFLSWEEVQILYSYARGNSA